MGFRPNCAGSSCAVCSAMLSRLSWCRSCALAASSTRPALVRCSSCVHRATPSQQARSHDTLVAQGHGTTGGAHCKVEVLVCAHRQVRGEALQHAGLADQRDEHLRREHLGQAGPGGALRLLCGQRSASASASIEPVGAGLAALACLKAFWLVSGRQDLTR